ncbi:MAG: GUN4 domain-containing protein [Microcoleaceae cyanobacterium]
MTYFNEEQPERKAGKPDEVWSDPLTQTQELTVAELTQQVTQLEEKLGQVVELLGDIYRYGKLRNFLAAQQFREADEETLRVMLEISGQGSQDQITPEGILQFPCSSIQLIDQLWVKYSGGRFGFSVQNRIYQELGGNDDITRIDMDLLHQVGDRLGARENNKWIAYTDLNFSLAAPEGCFPAAWWQSPYGAKMIVYFCARIIACGI